MAVTNLTLRFIIEMLGVAALAYTAFQISDSVPIGVGIVVVANAALLFVFGQGARDDLARVAR